MAAVSTEASATFIFQTQILRPLGLIGPSLGFREKLSWLWFSGSQQFNAHHPENDYKTQAAATRLAHRVNLCHSVLFYIGICVCCFLWHSSESVVILTSY